jgi:DNA-binding NtrC family response regulator
MKANDEVRFVLVVDDEKVIADSLTAILCRQGYMARAVYSAEGAMNAASAIVPHTLISDVLMPEINGIELAAYFAEHHPDCRVVLMSGDSAAPGLLDTALRQGDPHSTQSKPVAPTQVLELLAAFTAMA